MNKQTTAKLGIEFMKAGITLAILILPTAFFLNDFLLAWISVFPLAIGFMLYSTSQ